MNEKSKVILAGFTGRKKRSQLTPHSDLICKLHQRGCTFREIVRILSENFNLPVAPSTVFRFIARLENERQKSQKSKPRKENPISIMPVLPLVPKSLPPVVSPDEIHQRIAVLKQRSVQTEPDIKQFYYNPDQPLHLVIEDHKT